MTKKKVMALLLVSVMLTSCMIGCSNKEEEVSKESEKSSESMSSAVVSEEASQEPANAVKKEGYPIVEETGTLSVFNAWADDFNVNPDEVDIHNEIKELTNVEIEWELAEVATWAEKRMLLLAREEMPDVLLGMDYNDAEYLNMIDAGQVIAIDEYLEYAPNFCEVLENTPGMREALTAEDGHIYAFPYCDGGSMEKAYQSNITYINQDWLDTLKLETPKTTDELKDVLVAFVNNDPNGNGIKDEVGITTVGDFEQWFGCFGILPTNNLIGVKNLTMMDGEVVYAPARDEYRKGLDWLHELWEAGAIDPEAFTQDNSMRNAKMKAETRVAGVFSGWRGTIWRLNNEDTTYSVLPQMVGPDGDHLYLQRIPTINSRAGALITKDCENIEMAVRWVDTLIDDKYSYQFLSDLREGFHFEFVGEGQPVKELTPVDTKDPYQEKLVDIKFICCDWRADAYAIVSDDPLNVDNERKAANEYYKDSYQDEWYPNIFMSRSELEIVSPINADLISYMNQFMANWIINGGDDAAWDAHLKQLDKLGLQDWLAVYEGALARIQ